MALMMFATPCAFAQGADWCGSQWPKCKPIPRKCGFPRIRPGVQQVYYAPTRAWHQGLTNEEIRAKTIWTGADREDRKMQAEIVEKQLRDGPESPDAIQLAWSRAQYFISAQKPALAEPLLKELIVTLESHASSKENWKILSDARAKLNKIQTIKARIENPSYEKRGLATRYSRGF